MFDTRADLDSQQRAVASDRSRYLRILAGAGTGKTTALTARAASLIVDDKVAPERILLLTFTRRAARQMMTRTNDLVRAADNQHHRGSSRTRGRIHGGTFHSVAHTVLRQQADRVGLPPGFAVLDPGDAADLFDVVRDQVVADTSTRRRLPRKSTLLAIYSHAIARELPVSDVLLHVAPWARPHSAVIVEICRAYAERKQLNATLDFDDLLLYWRAALADPQLGAHLAGGYDHVLVDEYQDVNQLQVELLQLLTAHGATLTAVGDDAQAIYGFRASNPAHILNFSDDFPDAHTLMLSNNYRSSQPIVDVANGVGADAHVGFSNRLTAVNHAQPAERPRLRRCADEDGQSDAVCTRILELREEGVSLREQAVLIRAAHHSDRLEMEMTARGIPYVKYGGLKFLEAAHIKDLLAAFRIADNPADELAWFRLLQLLPRVGPQKAKHSVDVIRLAQCDHSADKTFTAIADRLPDLLAIVGPHNSSSLELLLTSLVSHSREDPASHALRIVHAISPLIEHHYDNATARIADFDALVQSVAGCSRLADVAAQIALEPPSSTSDLADKPHVDEDYCVISTVHSAKGLEWDAVHIIHAADGNFPSDMALSDSDGLEEERRLFYVAVTRARRSLDIYVPLRFHVHRQATNDRHVWAQPSRFLTGAAAAHFTEVTHLRPGDFGDPQNTLDHPPSPTIVDASTSVNATLNRLWR